MIHVITVNIWFIWFIFSCGAVFGACLTKLVGMLRRGYRPWGGWR